MSDIKMMLLLTENQTMDPTPDVADLVTMAIEAEKAGFDAVMVSEHIVLGNSANEFGLPENPRDYALPGNQSPDTFWPSPVVLLSAVAQATSRIRLVFGALIAPLHHPLSIAKEVATLDRLSKGRVVLQPTVSWHKQEFDAMGVPFHERGAILDEQLEVLALAWGPQPFSFHGRYFTISDAYLVPGPYRSEAPPLWFGGSTVNSAVLRRLVRYGVGFNPLGSPSPQEMENLERHLHEAGRSLEEIELVGGTRANFPDAHSVGDLDEAIYSIRASAQQGYKTICIKPSQFIDSLAEIGPFCRSVVEKVEALGV